MPENPDTATRPAAADDDAAEAVRRSPLGQAASLVQKLTGLPPLACFVIVVAFGAYTGALQQYLPSGKQVAAAAAAERADNARQVAFLHAKLNETSATAIKARDEAADLRAQVRVLEATVAYLRGIHERRR